MVEVLFLGVGAALPMTGQTNSSFLLRTEDACILIDCGPAIMQQLAAVGVSPGEITHVFLTHRHGDHILGYPMLMLWWAISAPPGAQCPTIVAGEITFKTLDLLAAEVFGGHTSELAGHAARVALPDMQPMALQLTPLVKLYTQPMNHAEFAPDLGARFEVSGKVLAFTGDTSPNDNIATLARDADLLVHDSTYSATLNPDYAAGIFGHSTAQISGRSAFASNARHLALVHIDAIYEGKVQTLLQEAQHEFIGRVSIPVAGTLFTF
ncbi:MAG: MBL fold metallo-hydrolase [Chloroflexi bacterium]|nr:MBL fold metallo-hydrolase [Chloroflexota bacterium]MCL5273952.1 MBL fold metallo-hydrolase [Chloroflexota bacterium]